MANDSLYASALPLIEERDNVVVFGGSPEGTWAWGDSEEFGPARPIAPSEFVIDRRYWELCGKPEILCVGIANKEGWEKYIGPKPSFQLGLWAESVDAS